MKCKNHSDREAIGACAYCGGLFCEECLVEIHGKKYCKDHVQNIINEINSKATNNNVINEKSPVENTALKVKNKKKLFIALGVVAVIIVLAVISIFVLKYNSHKTAISTLKTSYFNGENFVVNKPSDKYKTKTDEAFEGYFENGTWKFLEKQNEIDLVEYKGVTLDKETKKDVLAVIRFGINEDAITYSLFIDGEEQNKLTSSISMSDVFATAEGIEIKDNNSDSAKVNNSLSNENTSSTENTVNNETTSEIPSTQDTSATNDKFIAMDYFGMYVGDIITELGYSYISPDEYLNGSKYFYYDGIPMLFYFDDTINQMPACIVNNMDIYEGGWVTENLKVGMTFNEICKATNNDMTPEISAMTGEYAITIYISNAHHVTFYADTADSPTTYAYLGCD